MDYGSFCAQAGFFYRSQRWSDYLKLVGSRGGA